MSDPKNGSWVESAPGGMARDEAARPQGSEVSSSSKADMGRTSPGQAPAMSGHGAPQATPLADKTIAPDAPAPVNGAHANGPSTSPQAALQSQGQGSPKPQPQAKPKVQAPGPALQTPAATASDLPFAQILEKAPVRIDIRDAAGDLLYSSGPRFGAGERGKAEVRDCVTDRYTAMADGRSFAVSVTRASDQALRRPDELVHQVYFDELTGLPNRTLVRHSVDALIGQGPDPFAIAFVSLDGFATVREYYGPKIADALLGAVATRLTEAIRATDMAARMRGDEFILLLNPIGSRHDLARDLEEVLARLREPFRIEGFDIFIAASVGVSIFPEDGASYDVLRTNADRAIGSGRIGTRGAVSFFDPVIENAAAERGRLEHKLRLMIRDHRVCCAYQPKVDIHTGRIVGVEVLMRWIDEDGIIQGPADFIALAAELGLLDDLTRDLMGQTIAAIDQIDDAFGPDTMISFNIAARQASDFDFMRDLVNLLDATGFARRFMFELTEEAFASAATLRTHILPLVRSVGVQVSIDDFGVGPSCLASLASITADEVKVDRTFIKDIHRNPRSQGVLRAIEALGTSLAMAVVVEGVETAEELEYLRSSTGIRHGQGYCFARPLFLGATLDQLSGLSRNGAGTDRLFCPNREGLAGLIAAPKDRTAS